MKTTYRASVQGMHCAACSSRIERVVGKMDGVESAVVNLATEKIVVEADDALLSFEALAERVAALGFSLTQQKPENELLLKLTGMHCAACSSRIEKVIGKMDGVVSASVNLATEQGHFVYLPETVGPRAIRERIEKLGFGSEPVQAAAAASLNDMEKVTELRQAKRSLIAKLILALPLLVISMGHMVGLQLPAWLAPETSPQTFALVQFFLAVAIMWLGRNFYTGGIPALLRRAPNMDSLIAVGTGAAFLSSCWRLVEILVGMHPVENAGNLYFESAGVLIALVSLGKYLELRSKTKSSEAIRLLMQRAPKEAVLLDGEEQRIIPAAEIEPGDLLLVKPGAHIPTDGTIAEGIPSVDEALLTGEPMPVTKKAGDSVFGGTVNGADAFTMRAGKTGAQTVLAGIIRMVTEAQGSKPAIARIADRVSYYFVPSVMLLALVTGLCWYFIGGVSFSVALRFFVAVMVIACPCAMGLATPISVMVGTGRGAQLGILIKNGETLELLEKTKILLFDKTGTITEGRPVVDAILPVEGEEPGRLMQYAAAAEKVSEHPLARAVIQYCEENTITPLVASKVENFPGRGIVAAVDQGDIVIGNRSFCAEQISMDVPEMLSDTGGSVLYIAVAGRFIGNIIVADRIRPEAQEVISALKRRQICPVMLTGDTLSTAGAVAAKVGIDDVVADVLPDGKAAVVQKYQQDGTIVAMVGDGINDAPALAMADIGIAMGTGIDIAMEAGDMVLMRGDLRTLASAVDLSRAVMRNIRQNLFWAFGYNVIGIPVAAGLLFAFGGPQLNPMIAGAAMAASSVSVVTNALRLRFFGGGGA